MKKVVFISCSSKKRSTESKAKDLYVSPLFVKSLSYAHKLQPDLIFILSAKYGLIELDRKIEPYDITLKRMPAAHVKVWSNNVLTRLSKYTDLDKDHFIILAGSVYRKHLIQRLRSYEIPLEGMTIGRQLQHLKKQELA